MRDRYYRVTSASEALPGTVLVHLYRRLGEVVAHVEGEDLEDAAQPDLVLFRAALERLRKGGVGIFVLTEDTALWQNHWGDLVNYRGGQKWKEQETATSSDGTSIVAHPPIAAPAAPSAR